MTSAWDGPITDDHFHVRATGSNVEAARQFERAGGTDLVLVHCPEFGQLPETGQEHREAYAWTVDMADRIHREVGLGVRVMLGPHPVAFEKQVVAWGADEQAFERAEASYWTSIDEALHQIHEGRACGIGEVGRPHFEVESSVWDASNRLLLETMELAASEGVPLQLHLEAGGASTYSDMVAMADRAGLPRHRLVRHFAGPEVGASCAQGVIPSVILGSGDIPTLVEQIERDPGPFLLETDHMDDPNRPGAVLGPRTVPKRTRQLLAAGLDEVHLWAAHRDLPDTIYGPSRRPHPSAS